MSGHVNIFWFQYVCFNLRGKNLCDLSHLVIGDRHCMPLQQLTENKNEKGR